MPSPPRPTQKRYRGRTRANIRSAFNHLTHLHDLDAKYRAGPADAYPNQLYAVGIRANIDAIIIVLDQALQAVGPIPSRV